MIHWPNFDPYCDDIFGALRSVKGWDLENAVEMVRLSNVVFTCGNGGSASSASHFTQDLMNSCGIKSLCLNESVPMMTAIANDVRYDAIYSTQLAQLVTANDLLFVISGSGNSPNIIQVLKTANVNKLHSISLTGFDGGQAKSLAEIGIHVPIMDMRKAESAHSLILHFIVDRLSRATI